MITDLCIGTNDGRYYAYSGSCYFVPTQPRKIESDPIIGTRTMAAFEQLPRDIFTIILAEPQIWRPLRLVSTYYNRLLRWQAYVDTFTVVVETSKSRRWSLDGKRHREHDLPAAIYSDGTRMWYHRNQLHRGRDRPARIEPDDTREWYWHDQLHRDHDRPAIMYSNGSRTWFRRGKRHREHGLPTGIGVGGGREWIRHDVYRRKHDRPAIIWGDGSCACYYRKTWYLIRGRPARAPLRASSNDGVVV